MEQYNIIFSKIMKELVLFIFNIQSSFPYPLSFLFGSVRVSITCVILI